MPGINDLIPGTASDRELPPTMAEAFAENMNPASVAPQPRMNPSRGVDVAAEYAQLMESMKQPVQAPNRGVLGNLLTGFAMGPRVFEMQSQEQQQAQALNAQMKQHRLMLLNKLVDAEDKDDLSTLRSTLGQLNAQLKAAEISRKELDDKSKADLRGKQGNSAEARASESPSKIGLNEANTNYVNQKAAGMPDDQNLKALLALAQASNPRSQMTGDIMGSRQITPGEAPANAAIQPALLAEIAKRTQALQGAPAAPMGAAPAQAGAPPVAPENPDAIIAEAENTKNLKMAMYAMRLKFPTLDPAKLEAALRAKGYK